MIDVSDASVVLVSAIWRMDGGGGGFGEHGGEIQAGEEAGGQREW